MDYFKHIKVKLRYNPFISILLDALGKIGINIQPFYVFIENIQQQIPHQYKNRFKEYDICLLGQDDMAEMAAIPSRKVNEAELSSRLKNGNICLGAKYQGQIVSFSWCAFNECHYEGYRFTLNENEAYTYDAFTDMEHRGKELAVYLRYRMYEELTSLEKRVIYSISNQFYIPANRFKQKLNAPIVDSGIFFEIFKTWHSDGHVNQERLERLREAARC